MVSYCFVKSCSKNSRRYGGLTYYSFPKCPKRQLEWLKAIGQPNFQNEHPQNLTSKRICSLHFAPFYKKKRSLTADAVPSVLLDDGTTEKPNKQKRSIHNKNVCNNCKKKILNVRFICLVCYNYYICRNCEAQDIHKQHSMLRIFSSLKPDKTDISNKTNGDSSEIQKQMQSESETDDMNKECSSDDEPIYKYAKGLRNLDLDEETKGILRDEVARAILAKTLKEMHSKLPTREFIEFTTSISNQGLSRNVNNHINKRFKTKQNKGRSVDSVSPNAELQPFASNLEKHFLDFVDVMGKADENISGDLSQKKQET